MKTYSQKQFLDWCKKQPADRKLNMGCGSIVAGKNSCVLAQFFASRKSIDTKMGLGRLDGVLRDTAKAKDIAKVNLKVRSAFDLFDKDFDFDTTYGELMKHLLPKFA